MTNAAQVIRFEVDPPASKKNRRRWARRGHRKVLLPSVEACAAEQEIALAATRALAAAGREPWGRDAALHLELVHDVDRDCVVVTVSQIGSLPARGRRGTKRDCHGMLETVADALEGVLFANDNQVDAGSWRRLRAAPNDARRAPEEAVDDLLRLARTEPYPVRETADMAQRTYEEAAIDAARTRVLSMMRGADARDANLTAAGRDALRERDWWPDLIAKAIGLTPEETGRTPSMLASATRRIVDDLRARLATAEARAAAAVPPADRTPSLPAMATTRRTNA